MAEEDCKESQGTPAKLTLPGDKHYCYCRKQTQRGGGSNGTPLKMKASHPRPKKYEVGERTRTVQDL